MVRCSTLCYLAPRPGEKVRWNQSAYEEGLLVGLGELGALGGLGGLGGTVGLGSGQQNRVDACHTYHAMPYLPHTGAVQHGKGRDGK